MPVVLASLGDAPSRLLEHAASLCVRAARDRVEQMRAARVGDPMSADTEVGPLARHDLRDALHRQVQASIERAPAASRAARFPRARALITRRPYLPMYVPGCPPTRRNCSARLRW